MSERVIYNARKRSKEYRRQYAADLNAALFGCATPGVDYFASDVPEPAPSPKPENREPLTIKDISQSSRDLLALSALKFFLGALDKYTGKEQPHTA